MQASGGHTSPSHPPQSPAFTPFILCLNSAAFPLQDAFLTPEYSSPLPSPSLHVQGASVGSHNNKRGSLGSFPLPSPPAVTRLSALPRPQPGSQKGMESSHKGLWSGRAGDAVALPDGQARSFLQGQAIIRHGEKS